jgi:HK97 family phage portal protein
MIVIHDERMGFLDRFAINAAATPAPQIKSAAYDVIPNYPGMVVSSVYTSYEDAMQVPACARARNIIAGTIGTLGVNAYNKVTGAKIEGRSILEQPDPAIPTGIVHAWTASDILFHGVSYWQVLEASVDDARPLRARRIEPQRVSFNTDYPNNNVISGFWVDGSPVPMQGVGSLIMFNGMDNGVLVRGGRAIRTALELEKAAARMADEPVPTMVIKNTGVDLPPEQVSGLLSAWRAARQQRATAYLSGPLDVQAFGFDASQMQLVEARQFTASEIARLVGIPAWFLNAESASMTYSNSITERRNLVEFSLRPIMACIEQRLSMDDITPRGQVVRFDLDDYLRGNPQEQVEVIGKMLELGLIDIDEAREEMDLAPRGNENAN